ncbi:MAG TPA: PPC domain-containing protein, partial [Verrucomicrobiae bacterium]
MHEVSDRLKWSIQIVLDRVGAVPNYLRERVFFLLVCAGLSAFFFSSQAAPPVNDQCFNAEIIPANGPFPYRTTVTDIRDASTAGDPPIPSCIDIGLTIPSRSVWYSFHPAETAFYTLSTCRDAPTDTTMNDNFMGVYTSAGGCSGPFVQLPNSSVTRGCADESCGPGFHQAAITTQLASNTTYLIVVWQYDNSTPPVGNSWLQLRVSKATPPANDACASAVPLNLNIPVSGSSASTIGAKNDYQLPTNSLCLAGQAPSIAAGPDVVYSFTAPDTANYSFNVRNFSEQSNLVVYVTGSCPAASGTGPITVGNCLAAAHRNDVSSAEEVYGLPMTNGQTVYVFVDENVPSLGSTFTIEVTRCFLEKETNDTQAAANSLAVPVTGAITAGGDIDFYTLGNCPPGSRLFAMIDGSAARHTDFSLRAATDTTVLQFDSDSNDFLFGDLSPNVAGTILPGGPAYLRVNSSSANDPYKLYAVVQPPLASATVEVEPNDTIAAANDSPLNYFYGTLSPSNGPSMDVDVFSFQADNEGDLIFVSLDGDPLRNKTPIDARLELLDSQGSVIITVDNMPSQSPISSTNVGNGLGATTPYSPGEALVFRAPSEGTYYVRVSISPNALLTAASGDYLLSISKNGFAAGRGTTIAPVIDTANSTNGSVGVPAVV